MQEETGIADDQIIIAESVKKADCEKKAAELVEKGCDIIFAENPNLESILEEAAKNILMYNFVRKVESLQRKVVFQTSTIMIQEFMKHIM